MIFREIFELLAVNCSLKIVKLDGIQIVIPTAWEWRIRTSLIYFNQNVRKKVGFIFNNWSLENF